MSVASQTIKNYRTLLKHVKSLPSAKNWTPRVVEQVGIEAQIYTSVISLCMTLPLVFLQYKAGRNITDPKLAEHHRSIADQYVTMVSSIKEITHLRGLDFGEKLEPRDKIRATASRVGLAVPRVSFFI